VGSFGGSSYLPDIRIGPSCRFRLKVAFKRRFRFLHVASASSGPAPLGAPARGSPKGGSTHVASAYAGASLVPRALTLPRRAPARRFRFLGTCALRGAQARGSPKGARPRAWSLARLRSRGARLLPSGRLRAPRPGLLPGRRAKGACSRSRGLRPSSVSSGDLRALRKSGGREKDGGLCNI